MKPTSKQSEEWGTHSMRDPFSQATLALTALFAGGICAVLLVMNVLMYSLFIQNLHVEPHNGRISIESAEQIPTDEEVGENALSEEVREQLIATLFTVDAFVLVLGIAVGYVLARKTLRPLRLSYERQKRFVSDAAHELRTPLAVMKAGVEVTLSAPHDQKKYETVLNDTLEEITTLTHLTDDLLLLSREEKVRSITQTAFSLSECVRRELRLIDPYAKKAGVVLSDSIDDTVKILGDSEMVGRAVTNLLKNAIDYTRENGTVHVALSADSESATLTITDTGIGIAQKDLPHVFERFYKADTARTSRHGSGAGLGLSIVNEIVRSHAGTISITSEPGKGTQVRVSLPRLRT